MTKFSIIRDKDWQNQFGVVATDEETEHSIVIGKFKTHTKAVTAIEKFTDKTVTQVL